MPNHHYFRNFDIAQTNTPPKQVGPPVGPPATGFMHPTADCDFDFQAHHVRISNHASNVPAGEQPLPIMVTFELSRGSTKDGAAIHAIIPPGERLEWEKRCYNCAIALCPDIGVTMPSCQGVSVEAWCDATVD